MGLPPLQLGYFPATQPIYNLEVLLVARGLTSPFPQYVVPLWQGPGWEWGDYRLVTTI